MDLSHPVCRAGYGGYDVFMSLHGRQRFPFKEKKTGSGASHNLWESAPYDQWDRDRNPWIHGFIMFISNEERLRLSRHYAATVFQRANERIAREHGHIRNVTSSILQGWHPLPVCGLNQLIHCGTQNSSYSRLEYPRGISQIQILLNRPNPIQYIYTPAPSK